MKYILRRTTERDVNLLFQWANEVSTRKNSIQTNEISWDTHVDWFKTQLKSDEVHLFILEVDKRPCGQIRFFQENDMYLVSLNISKEFQGKGLGSKIVAIGVAHMEKMKGKIEFRAMVLDSNTASERIFKKNNFQHHSTKQIDSRLFHEYRYRTV